MLPVSAIQNSNLVNMHFSINVFMCVVCLLGSCIIVGSCYCDESKHECKKLSKRIGNYQKLIQSNPTSHPPNEKKYTNNR